MNRLLILLFAICFSASSYGQNAKILRKAEAGDAKSQYSIASRYKYGWLDTPKDDEKYVYWLEKAANSGVAKAQYELSELYCNGDYGVSKDDEKYVYWLKKAANSGVDAAQYNLGNLYHYGEHGVSKDESLYIKWAKKAAFNGYHPACYSLGLHYKDENKQEAIYWFKKGMDLCWKEEGNENEYCAEELRELGVYYHPGDNTYHSNSSITSTSSNSSSTSTSSNSSNNSTPVRQLQPVQEWNPCLGCGGTGLCIYCQGKGKRWYGNSYEDCITCHGNMYCQQCYGRKGYYTTVYR